jgi:radical SAM superfamily enzyme YgiQ (UPF0313 family)
MAPTRPDVLLVFPNNRHRAFGPLSKHAAAVSVPVQLGLTATYCRSAGLSVAVLDADAENLDAAETAQRVAAMRPALALLSTDSLNSGDVTKMAATSETLRALRTLAPAGIPTAVEGVVPSAFPERMLREEGADFAIVGEAFEPVVDLVRAIRGGALPKEPIAGVAFIEDDALVDGGRRPLVDGPEELPAVAWDLLPMDRYRAHHWHCFDRLDRRQPYASIYTNLGCPYNCTFCNVNVVYGGPNFRPRSVDSVLAEIDLLVGRYGVHNLRIVDNVFTIRPDLCEELCDRIAARGHDLNMWVYARVETIRSAELLRKMKRAGINWVAYGIEAGSAEVRKDVSKSSNQSVIDRAIDMTREAGIHIVGNFIFGLPEDTHETMRQSLDMAKAYNFEYANFYSAMAYPGTALHEQALREGIPLPESWSGYGQYSEDALPLRTRHLSAAEVLRFRDDAFVEYNSSPRYQQLVERKFGSDAVAWLRELVKVRLPRKLLDGA